jgi:hypothetical protein
MLTIQDFQYLKKNLKDLNDFLKKFLNAIILNKHKFQQIPLKLNLKYFLNYLTYNYESNSFNLLFLIVSS